MTVLTVIKVGILIMEDILSKLCMQISFLQLAAIPEVRVSEFPSDGCYYLLAVHVHSNRSSKLLVALLIRMPSASMCQSSLGNKLVYYEAALIIGGLVPSGTQLRQVRYVGRFSQRDRSV
jgi:hypothetical protein